MEKINLFLPLTVLQGLGLVQDSSPVADEPARAAVLIEGDSSQWVAIDEAELGRILDDMAVLLRRWVFQNGLHLRPLLTVRIGELDQATELPPNVSAGEIQGHLACLRQHQEAA